MRKVKTKDFVEIALLATLMCVAAFIYIPLALPITLQTLVLFFGLYFLGGKSSSISVLIYICIGALGIPVFSGFSGGLGVLLGARGGYIFGMLISTLVFWLLEVWLCGKKYNTVLSTAVSLIIIYIVGTLWYSFVYLSGRGSFGYVLSVCVLPFVFPDVVKAVIAYYLAKRMKDLKKH